MTTHLVGTATPVQPSEGGTGLNSVGAAYEILRTNSTATAMEWGPPISSGTLNDNRLIVSSGGAITEAAAITPTDVLYADTNGLPTGSSNMQFINGDTLFLEHIMSYGHVSFNTITLSLADSPVNISGSGNNFFLSCATNTGAITINLPNTINDPGRVYIIKDVAASAALNNVTINATGGMYIDNPLQTTITISTNSGFYGLYNLGTSWQIWTVG